MDSLFKPSGNAVHNQPLYAWSNYWHRMLSLYGDELSKIQTTVINIDPNEPYGFTYVAVSNSMVSKQLYNMVCTLAELLINLNPSSGIVVFEKLLSNSFTAKSLHGLFSLLSSVISDKHGLDKSRSIHSPINPESCDNGFPIHADLFKPRAILNVITCNDEFEGGDILLVSLKELSSAMYATRSMPSQVVALIMDALTRRISHDGFDFIFDLIHGDHPWTSDLRAEIESRQICIPGSFGVGYFAVDGQWLHGRTKIHGPVLETRLERLVFDTQHTISLQPTEPFIPALNLSYETYHQSLLHRKALKGLPNEQG
jgi:hypothetical protein